MRGCIFDHLHAARSLKYPEGKMLEGAGVKSVKEGRTKKREQDIFTELKVSTSASHRPILQLKQSTQGDEDLMSLSVTLTRGSDVCLIVPVSVRHSSHCLLK